MRKEEPCKVACRVKLDAEAAKNFKEKIDDEYRVNMYVFTDLFLFNSVSRAFLMLVLNSICVEEC